MPKKTRTRLTTKKYVDCRGRMKKKYRDRKALEKEVKHITGEETEIEENYNQIKEGTIQNGEDVIEIKDDEIDIEENINCRGYIKKKYQKGLEKDVKQITGVETKIKAKRRSSHFTIRKCERRKKKKKGAIKKGDVIEIKDDENEIVENDIQIKKGAIKKGEDVIEIKDEEIEIEEHPVKIEKDAIQIKEEIIKNEEDVIEIRGENIVTEEHYTIPIKEEKVREVRLEDILNIGIVKNYVTTAPILGRCASPVHIPPYFLYPNVPPPMPVIVTGRAAVEAEDI